MGFFRKTVASAFKRSGLSKEEFAYRVLPSFLLDIIQRYLRVECQGTQNLPKKGGCIVIANHSGFMGFDVLMLGHHILRNTKRVPRTIAHKLWFINPEISVHAHKLGLVPATYENALHLLENKQMLLLFPEGEEGNFKPSRYRYHLRHFRRGFVRLALKTGAPIIPATVIGAEETHITVSQIRWAKDLLGIIIPVPLNVLPLPARWHIKFHKPVTLKKNPEKAEDIGYVTQLSKKFRHTLQRQLHLELRRRKRIYL